MTPTNDEYIIAAFCEAVTNDVDNRITWEALSSATGIELAEGMHELRGVQFDANITAAIQAGDWLDRVVERYRG